jgi:hypothetical protein
LAFLAVAFILWPHSAAGQHPVVPKLTLSQVEQLVSGKVPDSTLSTQIQKRGLAFTPTPAIVESLRAKGAGPLTMAAVEAPAGSYKAAIPGSLAQNIPNENSALTSLRSLIGAEEVYALYHGARGFTTSIAVLVEDRGTPNNKHAGLVAVDMVSGIKDGYQFSVRIPQGASIGGANVSYFILAKPVAGQTGRTFCAGSSIFHDTQTQSNYTYQLATAKDGTIVRDVNGVPLPLLDINGHPVPFSPNSLIHYAAQGEECRMTSPTL